LSKRSRIYIRNPISCVSIVSDHRCTEGWVHIYAEALDGSRFVVEAKRGEIQVKALEHR